MSTLTDGDDLSPELQAAVSAILEIGLEFKVHLHHPPLPFKTAVDDEGNPSTCYSVAPPTTTAASPWDPDIQKQSPSYLLIPTPRITACIACRAIHRKCSSSGGGGTATQPCSRCVKQKLECVYTTTTDSFAPSVSRDGLSTKRSANLVSGSFDEGGDQMGLEQDTCTAVPPLEKRKKQQIESKVWKPVKAVSCKLCYLKKVKCDKLKPTCSGCAKRKIVCEYIGDGHGTSTASAVVVVAKRPRLEETSCSPVPSLEEFESSGESSPLFDIERSPPPFSSGTSPMESLFPIHSTKPLAEIILDRLHKSKPMTENTRKRLRCGKLWCLDPITQEKIYICPVCAKEYKTSNGLKYHLNGHAAESFPQGYFWKRMNVDAEEEEDEKEKGKKELMQEEKKAFQCMVEGCQNSYASLGGLKYHRQKRHGGDHHHHGDGKLVHV